MVGTDDLHNFKNPPKEKKFVGVKISFCEKRKNSILIKKGRDGGDKHREEGVDAAIRLACFGFRGRFVYEIATVFVHLLMKVAAIRLVASARRTVAEMGCVGEGEIVDFRVGVKSFNRYRCFQSDGAGGVPTVELA